jgi:integrin beta 3
LGFDDLDVVFDEARGYLLRWQRGTQLKEWALPFAFDAGVWQAGRVYPKGAGTTVKGAWWIAQTNTSGRPGDSRDWRLAVKGGRDGKDGKDGKDGE